jgi:zinc/manganese transport system ATP-binding protein
VTPPAIRLMEVTLRHGRRAAVENLSGCFAPGSLTAVVGPNGAGKTTLLRGIAGLHPLSSGGIDRGTRDRAAIAFLPQVAAIDRSFPINCLDVVALGHWARVGAFRSLSEEQRAAAVAALACVGMDGLAGRPIGDLSAGQLQRVLFARLIVQDAPVLLLDEPFNALDEQTEVDLLRLILRWHGEGRTVVAVLHDLDLVRAYYPATLLLAREQVAWGPTAEVLSTANRREARLARNEWPVLDRRTAA